MLVPRSTPVVDYVAIRSIQLAVDRHIRRFNLPKDDSDDLVQEVALHLLQRTSDFNPSIGAWSTFVKCVVRSKLASIRRNAISGMQSKHGRTKSLNLKACDQDGRPAELGDLVQEGSSPVCKSRRSRSDICSSDMTCDVKVALQKLAPDLRSLCQALMEDSNISEASDSLQVSRSTVYRRIVTIRETFVEHEIHRYR